MSDIFEPQLIEGIKCYAPESAYSNENYSPDIFDRLFLAENKNFWFRSRNRIISSLVQKLVDKKKENRFLEIGCGTGFVLKGLSKIRNIELTGAEIYIEGLKYTQKRLPGIELVQLDAVKMPFRNKFDTIGAFDVLEHIEQDEKVMQEINLALKPGGHFVISVPQYPSMWSYLDDMAYHKRRYTKKELKQKLEAAGFSLEYLTSFVFLLFPLMWLSRKSKAKKKSEYSLDDQMKELELSPLLNGLLGIFMRIDEGLLKLGLRLPAGGSLIAVAKKNN